MNRLQTIDADTLQSTAYEPVSFVVDDLLPQGLHLLAGAPKIGKSWLALWLCLCAAQGKPLWTFATRPCEVLYLCLEDSFQRIQSRLFDLTEDAAITLDKTAMQSVVETVDGNDIQLHVSTGDALSSDQTEIIGDIEQGMVLDVSLTANGTEIHSFNGKVTVSVPFTWTQQGVLQAWYLADDGTKEPVEVAYRDGNAVLTLKHFSTYAIVVKANDPDSGIVSMGENEVTVQKQADAVYYAAALYVEDGRFLAYAASEAAEDEETVTLKWANADWSKAAKVKVFFLDADRKPVAEAVTALIKGKSRKN